MSYRLEIKRSVSKEVRRLPAHVQQRVREVVRALRDDPRPEGCKRLTMGLYAVRVGEYRVIYEVDDERVLVTVIRVRHRREVYRNL